MVMRRLMIGLILALSGWACAAIYLILTGQAVGQAVAGQTFQSWVMPRFPLPLD
jgi:hypothetical protein